MRGISFMFNLLDHPLFKIMSVCICLWAILVTPYFWVRGRKGPYRYESGRLVIRDDPNEPIFKK